MQSKIFMVARPAKLKGKPRTEVFGFVSVFGWENPVAKAAKKYPEQDIVAVQEFRFPWNRRK